MPSKNIPLIIFPTSFHTSPNFPYIYSITNAIMKIIAIGAFISLVCCSCADFIEYPLEKEHVELLAPVNGIVTTDTVLTFWWETHEDAKYYRLQLVSPNFEQTEKLIADSVVGANQLTLELKTGDYAWRVRPENDGSVGLFKETRTLRIDKDEEQ